jgi:PhzF family phenazine biosynthesis protein
MKQGRTPASSDALERRAPLSL